MLIKKISLLLLAAACLEWPLIADTVPEAETDGPAGLSSGRWVLRADQPADRWEDAFVTGNGSHGTMVMAQAPSERITNVHEELFLRNWDRSIIGVPEIAEYLPKMRKLIAEGKNNSAFFVYGRALEQAKAMGAEEAWELTPHPAFDLLIEHQAEGAPRAYTNRLDLETGEALCQWQSQDRAVVQRVFSSRAHDVNVVSLKAGDGKKLNLTLSLSQTPGCEGVHLGEFDLDHAFRSIKSDAESGWLSYHADYQVDRGGYEGLARVTLSGGRMVPQANGLKITGADEVLVVIRITPLEDGTQTRLPEVKAELAALPTAYATLLRPHALEHGEMFRRVQLELGAAKQWTDTTTPQLLKQIHEDGLNAQYLETVHAMGRYLLISSCGKYPPPLMGIWGGDWKANWAGGFVLNSNFNLANSAAGMGNLPECIESYAGFVEGSLEGWRLNARNLLGCRGIQAASYARPDKGYMTHKNPAHWYYICQTGWILRPLYDYGLLSGDAEFMKERVLPLYLELGDFYEDFMVEDAEGVLHLTPGCSPENNVQPPHGASTQIADDCTVDIAVAREVYQVLIELGQRFGLPAADIAHWKDRRSRIAAYRINEDGALAEWAPEQYPESYGHRHNSHLYPIFPGYEFFQSGADPRLKEAAHVALKKRIDQAHRPVYPQLSGHGVVFAAQMASRLRDVANVKAMLEQIAGNSFHYKSMVTSHCPDGLYYNLDVGLSYPRILMEMLVFSHPGEIDLMPGWYAGLPDGNIQGVLLRGGHTIDLAWADGKMIAARLHSGANESLTVRFREQSHTLKVRRGQTVELTDLFNAELVLANVLVPGLTNPSGNRSRPGEMIGQSIDGKESTKWCASVNGKPVIWQKTFDTPPTRPLRRYALTSANDVPARDPIRWRLEGSNDGVEWTLLDQQEPGEPFDARYRRKEFKAPTKQPFQAYRFLFWPLDESTFQLAEIELNF